MRKKNDMGRECSTYRTDEKPIKILEGRKGRKNLGDLSIDG